MSFNVIIAGSRSFCDFHMLCEKCDTVLANKKPEEIVIVSGAAKGADNLGERYAHERGYGLIVVPAQWEKYGKSAGFRRNTIMADVADAVIAFWDGESPGTKHMIETAKAKELPIRIFRFSKEERS